MLFLLSKNEINPGFYSLFRLDKSQKKKHKRPVSLFYVEYDEKAINKVRKIHGYTTPYELFHDVKLDLCK